MHATMSQKTLLFFMNFLAKKPQFTMLTMSSSSLDAHPLHRILSSRCRLSLVRTSFPHIFKSLMARREDDDENCKQQEAITLASPRT